MCIFDVFPAWDKDDLGCILGRYQHVSCLMHVCLVKCVCVYVSSCIANHIKTIASHPNSTSPQEIGDPPSLDGPIYAWVTPAKTEADLERTTKGTEGAYTCILTGVEKMFP